MRIAFPSSSINYRWDIQIGPIVYYIEETEETPLRFF